LRRFDFVHLCAGIDQQLPAVAAGYPITDLDNTQFVKRCRPDVGPATHAAIYTITAKIAKPVEFAVSRALFFAVDARNG
jgi:hypothetical protein